MFNVDLKDFLNSKAVTTLLKVRLRALEDTDEYGISSGVSETMIDVTGSVVEKLENGFNVNTGTYFVRVVYKIYLDRKKYNKYDFTGAEINYNGKILQCTSYPLDRQYASHFVIYATEKRVVENVGFN